MNLTLHNLRKAYDGHVVLDGLSHTFFQGTLTCVTGRSGCGKTTLLRLLFDHPSVEAVTGWDFTDGCWLGAPSGLLTADNRPKPAYRALERLIRDEWHTECDVTTDENGCARVCGFKGQYALSDGARAADLHLAADGETLDVTLAR